MYSKVILIGGAPGSGKTTLARALASRLGYACMSADDILTLAINLTTKETHQDIHIMRSQSAYSYYTNNSIEKLIQDAVKQHQAVWPLIEVLIQKHLQDSQSPIVIDGWFMHPTWVNKAGYSNVSTIWIHVDAKILSDRESKNLWFSHAENPQVMRNNFLGRSLWFDELIKDEAIETKQFLLEQDGNQTVEKLCEKSIDYLNRLSLNESKFQ